MNKNYTLFWLLIIVGHNQSSFAITNPFSKKNKSQEEEIPSFTQTFRTYDWAKPHSSTTTRYGLSLRNKSNQDIFIVVENASLENTKGRFGSLRYFSKDKYIAAAPVFKAGSSIEYQNNPHLYESSGNYSGQYWEGVNIDLNIAVPTTITIYRYDRAMSATKLPHTTVLNGEEAERNFLPNAQVLYMAAFTPKKTIYIKWDGKTLSPQKGTLSLRHGGFYSEAGYSLKNNVKQSDIKKLG